ncbi:MAG: hypothetical protein ACSHYF_16415 [Verrucomicrobiaceae bacterium]
MAILQSNFTAATALRDEEDTISSRIAELERSIEEAPLKLQEELERERTMMPPPDDLADRARERKFYAELSRGELQNERRYRARSTVLFTLSFAATVSVCWWIYAELQRFGVLNF